MALGKPLVLVGTVVVLGISYFFLKPIGSDSSALESPGRGDKLASFAALTGSGV